MPESTIPSLSSDQLGCFRYLAKMFSDAQIRAEERTKYTHERFNVFTTLLSAHDEVRLHTRFLHCLLNPNGLHDCGALFLNLFFKTLAELPATNHLGERVTFQLPSSSATWTVEKEASRRRAGQIDLLLERTNFAIAIENKIYALEQPNQLARYSGYLRQHYGDAFKVIYLTRDGRASTTHNGCCNYIRISYAEHILAWLEQCLRETYSMPRINQVVVQYRDVVRAIALVSAQNVEMKPMIEYIEKNTDIIRFRKRMDEGIKAVRSNFLDRIAEGIIHEFHNELDIRLRCDLVEGRFGVDDNGAMVIIPQKDTSLAQEGFEIWIEQISKWDGLVIGIETKYKKPPLTRRQILILEEMNLNLNQYAKIIDCGKANPMSSWPGTYWPIGWFNLIYPLNDVKLAELLDSPFDRVLSDLSAQIRQIINALEKACRGAVHDCGARLSAK